MQKQRQPATLAARSQAPQHPRELYASHETRSVKKHLTSTCPDSARAGNRPGLGPRMSKEGQEASKFYSQKPLVIWIGDLRPARSRRLGLCQFKLQGLRFKRGHLQKPGCAIPYPCQTQICQQPLTLQPCLTSQNRLTLTSSGRESYSMCDIVSS